MRACREKKGKKQSVKYSQLKVVACTKMLKRVIFERGKRNGIFNILF